MKKLLLTSVLSSVLLSGCATTPEGKLHQGAKMQKVGVDGLANTYLDICEQIVRPQCIADNAAAKETEDPWEEEDRVACLTPCNSDNAAKIQTGLDAVIAAQLVVYGILKAGGASPEQLDKARAELAEAVERLKNVLDDTGATDFVLGKLYGN